MSSPSAILNKSLRAHVSPALRAAGFERIDARNGWRWEDDRVCVFKIHAVGRYFSDVTGWPASSVGVSLGVYYTSMPTQIAAAQEAGRALPDEPLCHVRGTLQRALAQRDRIATLKNAAERERRDLWWVDPEGSNADEVAADIAAQLVARGLPWLARWGDPASALAAAEAERDCLVKHVLAAHLARRAGDAAAAERHRARAESEGAAIGRSPGPDGWFALIPGMPQAVS
jgi:hypothetical protein